MSPVRVLTTGVACLALAALGTGAHASAAFGDPETGALSSAADAPLGAPVELRVDLRGEVAPRCELTARPTFDGALDLNRDGDLRAAFALDCNAPFTVRVTSGAGGLAAVEPVAGAAAMVPYELSLDLDTDGGRRDLGWCEAARLAAAGGTGCAFGGAESWSSGDDTAIDRTGALRLRWRRTDDALPALGRYGDALVIKLEVRP